MSTVFIVWFAVATAACLFIRGATIDGAQKTTIFPEESTA